MWYKIKICNFIYSDVGERLDITEPIFIEKCPSEDSGFMQGPDVDCCCPASPTTVPVKSVNGK